MKLERTLLLIALFAACRVMAQPQKVASSASAPAGKVEFHWFAPSKPAASQESREPVEGLSPQAWTTTVGWHPGRSAFPNGENWSPQLPLFWVGHKPWQ
jgi:hypothetical protein